MRTLHGANIGSEHLLLGVRIRMITKKLSKHNLVNLGWFDINKLEKQEVDKDVENSIKYAL